MPGDKTYKVNGDVYTIPEAETGDFLKDNPDAMEVQSFLKGKYTLDIPVNEVPDFLKDVPDAKPLKKKTEPTPSRSPSPLLSNLSNTASPSTDGGSASSGNIDYLGATNQLDLPDPKQETEEKALDIQQNNPDLLRAATTPLETTAKDQKNYNPELQKQLMGNQAQEAILRGGSHLVNSVLKTPAFLYDLATTAVNKTVNAPLNAMTGGAFGEMPSAADIAKKMPADNPVAALDAAEKTSQDYYKKDYNKAVSDYFFGDKPDYDKGFEALGLGVLENAPTTLTLMFGNYAGLNAVQGTLAGGAVFGADKMNQIENDPASAGMTQPQKEGAAIGYGLAEGVGEQMFGLPVLGQAIKNILTRDGAEVAAKVAKEGFTKVYGKILARYIGVGANEVVQEMATQFAQNAVDKYSGLNPKLNLMAGMADAGLLALGSSVSMAGPVAIMDIAKTHQAVKKAADITTQQAALNDDLQDPDVPDATKAVISNKIQDLNQESADLATSEKDKFDALTPEGQAQVDELVQQSKKLSDAANDPSVSDQTREIITKDVKNVEDAIDHTYETAKKPSEEEQKAATEAQDQDREYEIKFLHSLNEEVGLDADQAARLADLEKDVPRDVPQGTTENVPQSEDVADLEKQLKENKDKWFASSGDMKSYIEYRTINDHLEKRLKEADKTTAQNGKRQRKRQGQRENVLGTPDVPAEASQSVEPTATLPVKEESQDATKTIGQEKTQGTQEQPGENTEPEPDSSVKTKKVVSQDPLNNNPEDDTEAADVKDSPEHLQKLDDEITAMKAADPKVMDTKFQGMLERAYKMKADGKISGPTYTAFKNKVKDVYKGKKNIDAEELKIRSTEMIGKVKEKLLGQGYKNMALSTGMPVTPKTVSDLLDLTDAIIHKIIDAGAAAGAAKVSLAQATKKALSIVKNHPTYKKLVASKELDEKTFESELGKVKEEKPKAEKKKESEPRKYTEPKNPGSEEKKSLANRMFNAENLSQDVRNKIESFGLNYSQFTNEEAHEVAKNIIDTNSINGALAIARGAGEVTGSVKTMIYANIIDHYYKGEAASTNDFNRHYNATMQGVYADELDQFLRDSGRIISAAQKFYELSPAGIASKEVAGLRRENDKKKIQNGLTAEKEAVLSAINGTAPVYRNKPTREKLKDIRSKRSSLLDKLKDSWNKGTPGPALKSPIPLRDEHVVLMAKIAATYIEEGVVRTDALIKKIKISVKKAIGVKLTTDDLERIMNEKVDGYKVRDLAEKASKETPLTEKEIEQENKRKLAVLNQMMPKPRKKTALERQSDHEKIIAAYNAGAFDGAGRTYTGIDGKETTETFEDLFYERYGLTNVNKPEFKAKMKDFATAVHATPKNSALRNNAYQSMYNYIANYQTQTKVQAATNMAMDIFYAHILSSYETHIRNMKYNSTTVAINQTALLAEKKLLQGKPGEFLKIMSDAMQALTLGRVEAWQVFRNGAVSRFDKPGVRNALEHTDNKWLRFHKIPGRALRGADILATVPLYEMKQRELMYDYVRNEAKVQGKKLTDDEVETKVLEYLGRTPQRVKTAEKRASDDIEKVFGSSWKTDKKALANYRIRVAEIMEETRPEAVKEEAIQWAKRAVLTNEPRGIWKNLANALNEIGRIPGGKIVVPFVNVMMNLCDRMIERTPVSFVNVIRGKKGFGKNMEKLTDDETHELALKAINYSVGVIGLLALVGAADDNDDVVITGKNTGDYSKDQSGKEGGKLDPFSVYIKGVKTYEYKDSPLASLLAPVGYYRDYVKYGENDGSMNGMVKSAADYMTFVVDQNAMKGLNSFMNAISPEQFRKMDAKTVGKSLASTAQNLYAPNILKAVNNDVRGALGYDDKKVDDWHDAFFKDIPYAETLMLDNKYDHLGQPIKDQFKIPMVPFEKWQPVDPYYKFFMDHKYYPTYMKDKIAVVGNRPEESESFKEVALTKDNIRTLTKLRGDFVKDIMNTETEEGETVMQAMSKLSEDAFKTQMDQIFSKAGKIAKTRFFNGNEVVSPSKGKDDPEAEKEIKSAINDVVSGLSE